MLAFVIASAGAAGTLAPEVAMNLIETVSQQEQECHERESSPLKRLKRSRASISATAAADVMAARAAKTLTGASPMKLQSSKLSSERSSDSSDSTEEDEDSLVLRVRRAQAFQSGAMAATEPAGGVMQGSPGRQQGELSPRSKLAFDRGARAAEVAAKVAASMTQASSQETLTSQNGANQGPRRRGGA